MIESSTILDAVQVLYNLSCCNRKTFIVLYNSNRSNVDDDDDMPSDDDASCRLKIVDDTNRPLSSDYRTRN